MVDQPVLTREWVATTTLKPGDRVGPGKRWLDARGEDGMFCEHVNLRGTIVEVGSDYITSEKGPRVTVRWDQESPGVRPENWHASSLDLLPPGE